ncbi:hypothetical protein AKJ09_11440 [Labilithrix luteola]|uniref:IgGFc-binding protein N-terminal domain-containing protein n=1 Tax=Labilithrix luteola TaxID=1391654 RepID=A0A0K1QGK2_9BACT|nr:hypothetical protein AKJ09_11440 [Labilithrix luteola]
MVTTVGAASFGLLLFAASACSSDKGGFAVENEKFSQDAGVEAGDCPLTCSLDGQSIIRSCSGEIVETCPETQACGAAKCQDPCSAASDDRSSNGCEFYFQKPRFTKQLPNSCYAAYLVNTSKQPVEFSLELEGKPVDVSKAVFRTEPGSATLYQHEGPIGPGESVVIFLSDRDPARTYTNADNLGYISCPKGVVPTTITDIRSNGTGAGSSFHLTTKLPVGVTSMYPFGGAKSYNPTASLVLPVAAWSKEHIVVNGWGLDWSGKPSTQIFSAEDDTDVTIVPNRDIQGGAGIVGGPAFEPVTYRLGKGAFLQLVQNEELTGSFVTSTKPISIVGGHGCANIPTGAAACDILAQQIPAFAQWGHQYVGVAYRPRLGNEHEPVRYRIVAAREGTQLSYDPEIPPGAPTALGPGESAMFTSGTGDAFYVRSQDADHPFYLAAYMSSAGDPTATEEQYQGLGDPEFVNIVPAGQYLNSYTFYADPTYAETSLVIVRAKDHGEFKKVWLECAGDLTDFQPVGVGGEYEWTRVDLTRGGKPGAKFGDSVCTNGLQRMKSDGPFTATLWGWDSFASYAYPGGMAQRTLVPRPLVTVH